MARAHLYRPITDAQGNILPGASVRLLQPGTTDLIVDTLYFDNSSSITLTNPYLEITGVIDLYLPTPQRVRIGITLPSASEIYIEDYDVVQVGGAIAAGSLTLTDSSSVKWAVTIGTDGGLITTALP